MAHRVKSEVGNPTRIAFYGEAVDPYFRSAGTAFLPFDDGKQAADLVVLDPSLALAVDRPTINRWRDWARGWGLRPHRVGRLEVWYAIR